LTAVVQTARRPGINLRLLVKAVAWGAIGFAWIALLQGDYFHDAKAYWSVDYDNLYGESLVGRFGTYLYSPAFAQALWPLTLLPWPVFAAVWSGLNLAALIWMAGPLIAAVLLFIPNSPVADEISTGNIHLLIAAALVIGFRQGASYAFPLLTKVTPGVAVLWLATAGFVRQFAMALGVTAGIALVSFLIAPQQWRDWITLLTASSGVPVPADIAVIPGPLWLRTALAAVLVLVTGRLGWRWGVPVAATLALPVTWSSGLSVLVALIPLYRGQATAWVAQRRGR
jgi:Glycosyltransferase family 87